MFVGLVECSFENPQENLDKRPKPSRLCPGNSEQTINFSWKVYSFQNICVFGHAEHRIVNSANIFNRKPHKSLVIVENDKAMIFF